MERISVFDIFKIGVGPSSSHTLGPWRAAQDFRSQLPQQVDSICVELYGSLSKTGKGHGTDIAVQLGLSGFDPETIPVDLIDRKISQIAAEKQIELEGCQCGFDPSSEIIFQDHAKPGHPNTLTFKAQCGDKQHEATYYSVGGGFVVKAGVDEKLIENSSFPYPIDTEADLISHTEQSGLSIWEVVKANELSLRSEDKVRDGLLRIWETMLACMHRGAVVEGVLPGGLFVKRRAKKLSDHLHNGHTYENQQEWVEAIRNQEADFSKINNWVSCFAMSVNEENASFGRIVTAPTNGAAGVIPAVLMYHYCFGDYKGEEDIVKFLLTAGEIGSLFKKGATISAAAGGCQAEIGVSSAMAAAGLAEVMGATPQQATMAAEIAMEHHLGLTCDPIGGLVQIPCIERNTMGAMKAITAANLSLTRPADHAIVSLDQVIKTMWDTAKDMNEKYKETAEGGLAINLPVILPNC